MPPRRRTPRRGGFSRPLSGSKYGRAPLPKKQESRGVKNNASDAERLRYFLEKEEQKRRQRQKQDEEERKKAASKPKKPKKVYDRSYLLEHVGGNFELITADEDDLAIDFVIRFIGENKRSMSPIIVLYCKYVVVTSIAITVATTGMQILPSLSNSSDDDARGRP